MGAAVVDVEALDREQRAARARAVAIAVGARPRPSVLASHVDRLHLRVVLDLVGRAGLQHAAVVHHRHARRRRASRCRGRARSARSSCAAAASASSATSSRRSAGESPAAGSSNRIRRGAPASAMPISSWRCWPCARLATRSSAMCEQARALEQVVGRDASRHGAAPRAPEAEAAAGDAAHREEQVVAHRQVAKQQRRLVGAPQALADALVRRQRR